MCTYAALAVSVNSSCDGIRLKFSASVLAAMFTEPTFLASLAALSVHDPVMT